MRHTVRYGGIEPPPVSHERQAAFVSVYRIEAARETWREQSPVPASRKGGKCQEGTRFGGCVHRFAFWLFRWYHNSTDADNK